MLQIDWGVERVRAPLAWQYAAGETIRVAVLDTWVDSGHPKLAERIEIQQSFMNPDLTPLSENPEKGWHGTHVAGIIAASKSDFGWVGVAPSASLCCLNVIHISPQEEIQGYVSDIVDALDWCVSNKIPVANLSFGVLSESQELRDAIMAVTRRGLIVVAAAGNNGEGYHLGTRDGRVVYPAAYEEVIAVSGITREETLMRMSSHGAAVDLASPGDDIVSSFPWSHLPDWIRGAQKIGNYRSSSGTSMAAPHVSGVAALVLSRYGPLSPAATKAHLKATSRKLRIPDEHQGAGLVDAYRAVTTEPTDGPV